MLCFFSSPGARRLRNHTHFISAAAGGLSQPSPPPEVNNKINLIVMPVCGQESVASVLIYFFLYLFFFFFLLTSALLCAARLRRGGNPSSPPAEGRRVWIAEERLGGVLRCVLQRPSTQTVKFSPLGSQIHFFSRCQGMRSSIKTICTPRLRFLKSRCF